MSKRLILLPEEAPQQLETIDRSLGLVREQRTWDWLENLYRVCEGICSYSQSRNWERRKLCCHTVKIKCESWATFPKKTHTTYIFSWNWRYSSYEVYAKNFSSSHMSWNDIVQQKNNLCWCVGWRYYANVSHLTLHCCVCATWACFKLLHLRLKKKNKSKEKNGEVVL